MEKPCADIFSMQSRIEREFGEPLSDVVSGFIPLGLTRIETAETLEVSPSSLRRFCEQSGIHFPVNQPGRRDRIQSSMRQRAGQVSFAGERRSVAEWAERYGINRQTLHSRLRRGKSLQEALRP